MIRLLFWRLGLEFWNLVAALLSRDAFALLRRFDPPTLYFAFGANLDPAVLYRRRMRVLAQEEFLVRDYELRFTQQGPFKGGGFASLEYAPGKAAYGRLLTLTRVDTIRMDFSELLPVFHRHRRITLTQDGKTFYFYQASDPVEGLIPTAEYKAKIMQAAEQSPLIPPEVLMQLRRTPTLDTLEPVEGLNFFIKNYSAWPRSWEGIRRRYEQWCFALFRRMIGWSLLDRYIQLEPISLAQCSQQGAERGTRGMGS